LVHIFIIKFIIFALLAMFGGIFMAPMIARAALQGENLLRPPLPGWPQAYSAAGNGIKLVE